MLTGPALDSGSGGGDLTVEGIKKAVDIILGRLVSAGTQEVAVIRSRRDDALTAIRQATPPPLYRPPKHMRFSED